MIQQKLDHNTVESCDVVVVPDFRPKNAKVFELRMLFFLASWLENAGKAKAFPLHLACIGSPPQSVQWLASQCNASITVHERPDIIPGDTCNKLRGFDIEHKTKSILLLDADVIILEDFSDICTYAPAIAARPEGNLRVPEEYWYTIYQALSLPQPQGKYTSLRGELKLPSASVHSGFPYYSGFPFYNSGVLFMPANLGLRDLWETHMRFIVTLFDKRARAWSSIGHDDQPGLATAIESLKNRGVPFKRLANAYNYCPILLYKMALPPEQIRLLHATKFCSGLTARYSTSAHQVIESYRRRLYRRMFREWRAEHGIWGGIRTVNQTLLPRLRNVNHLLIRLQPCMQHVDEALHYSAR